MQRQCMSENASYEFEWDPIKAATNATKHGVSFEHAATVFLDALALTVFDTGHSEDEERWFTLGMAVSGMLLAISHTFVPVGLDRIRVRLISARAATRRERQFYENEPR